jgi:hypothetical protein
MGRRRLDNPQDFVRIEVESALRLGKRVIPVLVHKTEMPRADPLPEPLKPLARRNAVRLTQERFRADTQGLIKALEDALAEAARQRAANEAAPAEAQRAAERKAKAHDAARDLAPFRLRLKAWTKDRPWHRHALWLVVAGLVVLAAAMWDSLPLSYRTVATFGKIVMSDDTRIPLDSSLTSKLRETSQRLADGLRGGIG